MHRARRAPTILTSFVLLLLPGASGATDFFLDGLNGNDCGSCGTLSNPFKTLPYALNQALLSPGQDTIRVAAWPYNADPGQGGFHIRSEAGGAGVSLLGGYPLRFTGYNPGDPEASRDPAVNFTTLDGAGVDNVVWIGRDATNITLDGFWIQNGLARGLFGKRGGGGIYVEDSSSVIIRNNRIESNTVEASNFRGGGIAVFYTKSYTPTGVVEISQNVITGNKSLAGSGGGIAIYVLPTPEPPGEPLHPSAPFVHDNTIEGNAAYSTDLQAVFGGGVFIAGNQPRLENNVIQNNTVKTLYDLCDPSNPRYPFDGPCGSGGGIAALLSAPVLTQNTIRGNSARVVDGDTITCSLQAQGGAVYANAFYGTIEGNTIENNTTYSGTGLGEFRGMGGGLNVTFAGEPAVVTGNTLTGNRTTAGGTVDGMGGGVYLYNFGGLFGENLIESSESPSRAGGLSAATTNAAAPPRCRIVGNRIFGNTAPFDAGALVIDEPGVTELTSNRVNQNVATDVGVDVVGGVEIRGNTRVTNLEVAGNTGHGIGVFGTTSGSSTVDMGFLTVTGSTANGLRTHNAEGTRIRYSILFGNIGPNLFDAGTNQTVGPGVSVEYTLVGGASVPGLGNLDSNPLFVTGPAGEYLLSHAAAGQAVTSPAVDATGGVLAATFALGDRTTRTDDVVDWCVADMGFHCVPSASQPDSDTDGIPDAEETAIGSLPDDADTDDDGLIDGLDCLADGDGDTLPGLLDCDQDGDGLHDGLEAGIDESKRHPDSDATATCDEDGDGNQDAISFVPDVDTTTTTDHRRADTDWGGDSDGEEDANGNGRVDPGEKNPNRESDDDPDRDGLTNLIERAAGTDPRDADTDDDGVLDGADGLTDTDGDKMIDALDCDSDSDAIPDGTESGVTAASASPDTDTSSPCFRADADPLTRTNPKLSDTDQGGCADGQEDVNQNGSVDPPEPDPNVPADDGLCAQPPGEAWITSLAVAGTDLLVAIASGDQAVWHRLYRGTLASLGGGTYDHRASPGPPPVGTCRLDLPELVFIDAGVAGNGQSFYYLVVAGNIRGEGPYGKDDRNGNGPDPPDLDRPAGDSSTCP